jgi:hypothetical protein
VLAIPPNILIVFRSSNEAHVMKLLLKLVVVVVILVVLLGVVALFYIDSIAKSGIEKSATYALGVETTLDGASVGLLSGTFGMTGLNVSNAEGFRSDHFLTLDEGGLEVSLGSLRSDTIEVPKLELSGLDMVLEKKGGNANYKVIMENLKKLESGEKPPAEEGTSKDFIIKEVVIKDVHVAYDLLGTGSGLDTVRVPIDEIRLTDVGKDGGLKFSELTDVILKAIFSAVIANGGDLPGEVLGELKNGLAGLASLGDMGIGAAFSAGGELVNITGGVIEGVGQIGEGAAEAVGDIGEEIGKGVEEIGDGIGKGLGDLLGGNKDENKDDDSDK